MTTPNPTALGIRIAARLDLDDSAIDYLHCDRGKTVLRVRYEGADHAVTITPHEPETKVEAGPVPGPRRDSSDLLSDLKGVLGGAKRLVSAFSWGTTTQGYDYWDKADDIQRDTGTLPPEARAIIEEWVRVMEAEQKPTKPPVWLPDAKVGDPYVRRDGEIVRYEGRDRADGSEWPHSVGGYFHRDNGLWRASDGDSPLDLIAPYTEDNRPSGTCVGAGPAQFLDQQTCEPIEPRVAPEKVEQPASDDLEALLIQYLGASTDGAKAVADAFRRAARDAAGSR